MSFVRVVPDGIDFDKQDFYTKYTKADWDNASDGQKESILKDIDNSLSTYNPDSKISKFNNSDSCFLIDNHILNLFLLSDEVNSISDGAFDPSVKPIGIWCSSR